MYRLLALLALGCGCADSATVHVLVKNQGGVTKVGYRDGVSDWTWLSPNTSGDYGLVVEDDYVFLIVCQDGLRAFELASTRAEPAIIESCGSPAWDEDTAVKVSTEANTAAIITMERETHLPNYTGGRVDLSVHPGVYDLVATGALYLPTDPHIVIRRDRTITGDTTEPLIDLAGGLPMEVAPITIAGDTSGGVVKTDVTLVTKKKRVTIASVERNQVYVAPSSILLDGEQQEIFFASFNGQASRTVRLVYRGEPVTITLPEKLTGLVQFAGEEATWETLPELTWAELERSSSSTTAMIRASAAWLSIHGPNRLSFDSSGYPTYPPTHAYFTIGQVEGDLVLENGIALLP